MVKINKLDVILNDQQDKTFFQLIAIATFTKLADLLISAKTTLPWLLTSLGAPIWIISLLVPIRESGSLIPQWTIKRQTQNVQNRVSLWRWGIVIQAAAIGGILLVSIFSKQLIAGLLILSALLVLSLGRSLASLSMKDIQGINVKKGQRGKLVGIASSISGLLSLLTAVLMIMAPEQQSSATIILLVALAIALMIFSLLFSRSLRAQLSSDDEGIDNQYGLWKTLYEQADLRNLIISRCLLLHGALIAPFFVSGAATNSDSFQLPYFIIASAFASFLSSYLLGKLADKNAIKTLFIATLVCVLASVSFYIFTDSNNWKLNIALFFLLNLGYAGIRTGRKTYMLDIAQGHKRTSYVASANTVVGYVLLALGGIYALLQPWISDDVILIMTGALVIGLFHTLTMRAEK
ncbi:MAG: MFS transporter [Paraglaciecola sp.]|uniref:MFS transporter n=1 Tax=Paraglaciecola sp. TaxID=1920173 RepID=UPI00329A65CC